VVTLTFTVPVPAGAVAVIWVSLSTVKPLAAVGPNLTAVAPVNALPVIVTVVPPAVRPEEGLTAVTAGARMYAYWSPLLMALVPPVAVTLTLTVPVPAGAVAVIWVSLSTVKLLAAVDPKLTPLALVNPLPEIVTLLPPPTGPLLGLTPVTTGSGAAQTAKAPRFCENIRLVLLADAVHVLSLSVPPAVGSEAKTFSMPPELMSVE
jgi:hypothetical protein